ncbi:MAG TPA: hypothetical protein VJL57_01185 [Candidatus Paceibacterota bacterium]
MPFEQIPRRRRESAPETESTLAQNEQSIDIDKVAQDFTELAKSGKHVEMLVLRKQLNIPDREIVGAISEVQDALRSRLNYLEGANSVSDPIEYAKTAGSIGLGASISLQNPTPLGVAVGIGAALATRIAADLVKPGLEKRSLQNALNTMEKARMMILEEADYEKQKRAGESGTVA